MTVNARARARISELREQLRTVTDHEEIARIDRELSTAEAKALLSSDDEHLGDVVSWIDDTVTNPDRIDDVDRVLEQAFDRVRILSIDDLRDLIVVRLGVLFDEPARRAAQRARQNRLQA
jgi:hypothetical protein